MRDNPLHIEFIVEDLSGKKALEVLVPKIIGSGATFRIHGYKGLGRIPKDMKDAVDPAKRILLTNLPKLLKGHGRTFHGSRMAAAVVVILDLDDKVEKDFLRELQSVVDACHPTPETRFFFAIEEGEAWFLGDLNAIRAAYPNAKPVPLESYVNDSICGTWERLADSLVPGGARSLQKKGWKAVGTEKFRWAENIPPKMDPEVNNSPSFCAFRDRLRLLCGVATPHAGATAHGRGD